MRVFTHLSVSRLRNETQISKDPFALPKSFCGPFCRLVRMLQWLYDESSTFSDNSVLLSTPKRYISVFKSSHCGERFKKPPLPLNIYPLFQSLLEETVAKTTHKKSVFSKKNALSVDGP